MSKGFSSFSHDNGCEDTSGVGFLPEDGPTPNDSNLISDGTATAKKGRHDPSCWTSKRILIIACILLFVIIIVLLVVLLLSGRSDEKVDVCTTRGCVETGTLLTVNHGV